MTMASIKIAYVLINPEPHIIHLHNIIVILYGVENLPTPVPHLLYIIYCHIDLLGSWKAFGRYIKHLNDNYLFVNNNRLPTRT